MYWFYRGGALIDCSKNGTLNLEGSKHRFAEVFYIKNQKKKTVIKWQNIDT